MTRTIALFTDFGTEDIYVGQLHVLAERKKPNCQLVDLFHNVNNFDIRGGATLLAAMLDYLPHDSIVVGVVDPGVGGERFPIAVQLGERWLVGPDNGLFSRSIAWSTFQARYWTLETSIDVANTFHGRDVFLPVAIELASRELGRIHRAKDPRDLLTFRHAEDIKCDDWRVIHIDHYGNLISGIRGTAVSSNQTVLIAGRELAHADFYECVPVGECFWHVNSIGLLEIAANQDSAARALDVEGGAEIAV